jgi:hypothetical protein
MNIFVLDLNPALAAQYQCNKHVIKMTLESAQLLCSPFELADNPPYKRTHYNHPCAKWTRENESNYIWLLDHAWALETEYTYRYNKIHKSAIVIDWCYQNMYKLALPREKLSPFAQAMPDIYKNPDPVVAYRAYYINEKKRMAQWKVRERPDWYS